MKKSFEAAFVEYEKSLALARGFAGFVIDVDCFPSKVKGEKTSIDEALILLETNERDATYKLRGVSIKLRNILSAFFRKSSIHFAKELAKMDLDDDLVEQGRKVVIELEREIPLPGDLVNLEEAQKVYSKTWDACKDIKAEQANRIVRAKKDSALHRIKIHEEVVANGERLKAEERRAFANKFRARAHSLAELDSVVFPDDRDVQ